MFLVANLGSELTRLFCLRENGNRRSLAGSRERALGIIERLEQHPELNGRTGEIAILRNIITDCVSENPKYQISAADIEQYFMPFATRVLSDSRLF